MSFSLINEKRRMVPRWRSLSKTSLTGELATISNNKRSLLIRNNAYLDNYIKSWNKKNTVQTASDVIYYAMTTGAISIAEDQARFILEKDAPQEIKKLSQKVLNEIDGSFHNEYITNETAPDLKRTIYSQIKKIKSKLNTWPRNSILWVEKARLYTIINEIEKAKNSINIALNLDFNNRYVSRSSIRFYMHLSDYDSIQYIFKKNESLYKDPWLLAPFVSLQDVIKPNLRIKTVRNLIDNLDDRQSTELAGALATLELDSGSVKNSKKLFLKSISAPNDNTLAQAAWAESKIGEFVDIGNFHIPYMYEAITRDSLLNNQYEDAMQHCMHWMIDEPFSSVPATAGSYIAASFLDKLDCADQFCQLGLQANPKDKILLNNHAVILAKSDRVKDAYDTFTKIEKVDTNSPVIVTLMATAGLLLFRSGQVSEGRKQYLDSIAAAKKMNQSDSRSMAALHFAMEEIEHGELSKEDVLKIIDEHVVKTENKNILFLKNKVIDSIK